MGLGKKLTYLPSNLSSGEAFMTEAAASILNLNVN
jgi:hypothetical protein